MADSQNDRTTISITREAKKTLDDLGRKNETYSDVVLRLATQCGNRSADTNKSKEEIIENA
jgi:predicted CopG family antitoxin